MAKGEDYVAYNIPIKAYIGNYWIRGAGYYPGYKVRLFRKGKFRYEEAAIHPRLFTDGRCGNLTSDIIHYSYKDFTDLLHKFNRETSLEAQKWIIDGRKVHALRVIRKAISRFLKFYFQKRGYKYCHQCSPHFLPL